MIQIYPPIHPYQELQLDVGDGHSIFVELIGNPNGIPVIYLHGGPGAGISSVSRRLFDPQTYHIITFDQRGSGKSRPFAVTENNTTEKLLKDIESIREFLNIDSWMVCGGSWGATLALLYSIEHPKHVTAMILRGVFLARQQDFDWFLGEGGAAQLFPDHYQEFMFPVREHLSAMSITDAYYAHLTEGDELNKLAAAKAWNQWESNISTLLPNHENSDCTASIKSAMSISILECYYIKHRCFIDENYILDNVHNISDIPGTIIHGRYDMVCKLQGAYELSETWTNGELFIVPGAGHSENEANIAHAFCQASQAMAKFLKEE